MRRLFIGVAAMLASACAGDRLQSGIQTGIDVSKGACVGYLSQPRAAADPFRIRCEQYLQVVQIIDALGLVKLIPMAPPS